jgi:pentatricopeptide repeat protein
MLNDRIIRNGQISSVSVATSLIDMYAKCGSMDEAQSMFDGMSTRTVVTWNVLISGYTQGGQYHTDLLIFDRMKKQKEVILPVKVKYLCILKACGG